MTFTEQYTKAKEKLLKDKSICMSNRTLYSEYFQAEEKKLKLNTGGLLDDKNHKTLLGYVTKIKNVNKWFKNKPLKDISKKDFERVFNNLIEGKIKNNKGEPLKDTSGYIHKVFKSKLFKMAGLYSMVEKVTEDYKSKKNEEVRWLEEKDINTIVDNSTGKYKLLFQIGWDIGENISAFLLTKKRDYRKQYNEVLKEQEYLVTLRKDILKRSRKSRTEPTRFLKTVELLDVALKNLDDDDYVFQRDDNKVGDYKNKGEKIPMSLRCVEKVFSNIANKLKIKTIIIFLYI